MRPAAVAALCLDVQLACFSALSKCLGCEDACKYGAHSQASGEGRPQSAAAHCQQGGARHSHLLSGSLASFSVTSPVFA